MADACLGHVIQYKDSTVERVTALNGIKNCGKASAPGCRPMARLTLTACKGGLRGIEGNGWVGAVAVVLCALPHRTLSGYLP